MTHSPRRFRLELGLAAVSAALLLATILWRDWIEIVFRVDPDHGSGSLEWMIVAVTALSAVTFAALARVEWRKARAVTP
jgi:hypothetical protein